MTVQYNKCDQSKHNILWRYIIKAPSSWKIQWFWLPKMGLEKIRWILWSKSACFKVNINLINITNLLSVYDKLSVKTNAMLSSILDTGNNNNEDFILGKYLIYVFWLLEWWLTGTHHFRPHNSQISLAFTGTPGKQYGFINENLSLHSFLCESQ